MIQALLVINLILLVIIGVLAYKLIKSLRPLVDKPVESVDKPAPIAQPERNAQTRISSEKPKKYDASPVKVDYTKRKSLMPSNDMVIPEGHEVDSEGRLLKSFEMPERNWEFRFFGSQLLLDDRVILHGLPSQQHLLEIIDIHTDSSSPAPKVFIDGKEIQMIGADVDFIKRHILENEGE